MNWDLIFLYGSFLFRIIPFITTVLFILPRQIEEIKTTRHAEDQVVELIAWILFGFSIVYLVADVASLFVTYCRVSPDCNNLSLDLGAFLYSFGFLFMNVFGVLLYYKESPSKRIATMLRKRK